MPDESLHATGDGNLVELLASVRYRPADPRRFVLASLDPDESLRSHAEAALREAVAGRAFLQLLTVDRAALETGVRARLAAHADALGFVVEGVSLHDLHPPAEAVEAFYEVARAAERRDRRLHEAEAAALRQRRQSEAEARSLVWQGEATARETVRRAETVRDVALLWGRSRNQLPLAEELAAAGGFAARFTPEGWSAYRAERIRLLDERRRLTEFRLRINALAQALSQRDKLIVDTDLPGRRQLLLTDPPRPPAGAPTP